MPKITWCKPKVNYLAALLNTYRKERRISADELGKMIGCTGSNVRDQIRKPADMWRIRDLKLYCDALGIPYEDALMAAIQK